MIFAAEMGDKSQLMAVAFATPIGAGALLGTRLPERAVRLAATSNVVVFGLLLLLDAVRP